MDISSRAGVREAARRAEDLGYDALYTYDHVGTVDPFTPLVVAADATERLRVGPLVINNELHNPVLLARTGGTVLWIASGKDELLAWPPGLARCGLVPANLVLVRAERWPDALWAMEEALRCPAVTGALLAFDPHAGSGKLDLTATRRLQLAAEAGGALGLLLRPDAACADHTAAVTRWRVGSLGAGHGLDDPRWQCPSYKSMWMWISVSRRVRESGSEPRAWTCTPS